MSKMIQVRNVPDAIYGSPKSPAVREGMNLSNCIKRESERVAERPKMKEWRLRTQSAKPIWTKRTAAKVIRAIRDERRRSSMLPLWLSYRRMNAKIPP